MKESVETQAQPEVELSGPGIVATDAMAEAVRKILRYQFQVMLAYEAGALDGKDAEDVHQMRVAVRRMRAVFRLYGSCYRSSAVKGFKTDLREAGRLLGAVRDLDVFRRGAQRYLKTGSGEQRDGLDPLFDHWRSERKQARRKLRSFLESKQYRRFKRDFGKFVERPGAGVDDLGPDSPARHQVRHVLSSSIWQLYETVRAYEVVLESASDETLHALRIDCKFLRYTLEFFQEVLGPGADQLIKDVIAVQDHLGDLQDAVVASQLVDEFLADWQEDGAGDEEPEPVRLDDVQAYYALRCDEARSLAATFPLVWPTLNSVQFRQRLAEATLAL